MQYDEHRRSIVRTSAAQGFTLLELTIVVIIAALLFVYAVQRITMVDILAEKADMENTLGSLRSALAIQFAKRVADRRLPSVAELSGENPVKFLNRPPNNYLGELEGADPAGISAGYWYFDKRQRELIYRVRNADHFVSALDGTPRAAFKVVVLYEDANGNGRFDESKDEITGLRLEREGDFAWSQAALARKKTGTTSVARASVRQGLL